MDRSTVTGIVLGLVLIGAALTMGSTVAAFWNLPSFFIVVGGTLATTLIRYPVAVVLGSCRVIRQSLGDRLPSPVDLVKQVVHLSTLVRQESLLIMEKEPVRDRFLRRGIELCVDGVDPASVEAFLRTEVAAMVEWHERAQRMLRGMGASSPAFGMIGTLIGLVQMLNGMTDPGAIGGAMAVALLTTFYGAFLAYFLFLPLADKLAERTRQEIVNREIVIQGLSAILAGYHPRLVERRLLMLLDPSPQSRRPGRVRRRAA